MEFKQKITDYSLRHYKSVTIVMVVATLVLGALIPLIKVDTDLEDMLSAEEPARLFHNQTKRQFDLSDIVVVGIVNNKNPNGVFNPAPLAMAVIFALMLVFFRKLVLVISPMIVAMVAVISTMGLLIGLGYPVHIMSSMIPIFLMPIAVVDSIHILSEFFDLYTREKGRRATIIEVKAMK